ncbi:MAG: histidine phosphatase family protein [Alphaproteobacteria bacterium]|nr:MAG: histidine phosphatase family protein [Alphaproteobacteria bacterium]
MTLLALVRHMPTEWNAAGRLQGREDLPLLMETAPEWRVPAELNGFLWLSSPLRRAVDTAHRLGIEPVIEPRLAEMGWGAWEGQTLAGLRARLGTEMAMAEAAGLDLRPPGGESPREVQARIMPLLAGIARSGKPTAAITHKGVIRAVLSLATGWDMRDKPPHRLSWSAAHLFRLDAAGRPVVARLNLPLEPM